MNRKVELVIYAVIFVLFGILLVQSQPQTYFIYSISLWACFGITLAVSRYLISPGIRDKKIGYAFLLWAISLIACFFVTAHFFIQYLHTLVKVDSISYLQKLVIKETLPFLIIATAIGLINLIELKKNTVKRALLYLLGAAAVVIIGFGVKYVIDVNYEGNSSIQFITGDHKTLEDLLGEGQFANKVVYVDLWYSSCGPCIEDFGKLRGLKSELKGKNIEYLYLARETSHPNSFQLWKKAIKKYNVEGYHVYMSKELEENVWSLIKTNSPDSLTVAYPHYLIADGATIISYNSERPSRQLIDRLNAFTSDLN